MLPESKKQQIQQDAIRLYKEKFSGINDVTITAMVQSATAEATKAQILIDALEKIISDKSRITTHIYDIATDALNEYLNDNA